MWHLLLLEWKKAKKSIIFQVLIGLYMIALPSILLIFKSFDWDEDLEPYRELLYMFPSVWQYLGYTGNWLCFFFFGFLAVYTVTSEFANRTLRQNIITGLSRRQFFLAKLSFILAICGFATLYYLLCGLAIGLTNTETIYMSKMLQEAHLIPRYFLMCFGYMIFGLTVGLLVRRTGIALFLYLSYVMFIENIIRYGIHFQYTKNKSLHFYPMNAIEDLVPFNFPFNELAQDFLRKNEFSFFLTPAEAVITTLIYSSLFLWICYRILQKRDL